MSENSWVDKLVADCSHVETPVSWVWWSAVSAISAAAGNNYVLKTLKGDLIYRPNLYVMLLGDSGLGKGFPINRAKLLVQKANITRVIAGRSSIQAIVKELSTAKSSQNGKPPITDSRGFIVNGELSAAIIADVDSLAILTDLYDGHYNPEWTNLLKGDGAEKLKNPYITALFGSSPAHFYDSIPQANIEGGYIGRNLIIYEEKRSKDVDLLDEVEPEQGDTEKFDDFLVPKYVPHLEKIASNTGRLIPSDQARGLFNSWRREWRQKQIPDKTGFLNRVPDHSLKVAMCLCLARSDSIGIISETDMRTAIEKVSGLVYANKKAAETSNENNLFVLHSRTILDILIAEESHEMSRQKMLTRGYGKYNAFEFDAAIENLLEMGWVTRERLVAGKRTDWIIKLAGEPLANYNEWKKANDRHN